MKSLKMNGTNNLESLISNAKKALTDTNLRVRYVYLDTTNETEVASFSFSDYVPHREETVILNKEHYIVDNVLYNVDENIVDVIIISVKEFLNGRKKILENKYNIV